LDEPTSSLDDSEVEKLFQLMTKLKNEGVGIIFVTHFLEQVYAVCDKITVLRNGQLVGEFTTAELPRVQLVAKMMGKDFDDLASIKGDNQKQFSENPEDITIKAVGLGKNGYIKPFDLVIHKGEVVGFTGLLGSGRSETVRLLYGAEKADTGELLVKGQKVVAKHPLTSMNAGMAYLPEDRKNEGIIADLSVRENLILALQAKRGIFHLLSRKQQEEYTDKYIKMLQVKTANRETTIKSLSGGNQQKVIIGRWLLTNPDFLILDEPTNHIDNDTVEWLEKHLSHYTKALIMVTHDRYFLDKIVSRIFAFEKDGFIKQYEGGYSDYKQQSEQEEITTNTTITTPKKQSIPKNTQRAKKMTYMEQKEYETIADTISNLEQELQQLQKQQETVASDYVKL